MKRIIVAVILALIMVGTTATATAGHRHRKQVTKVTTVTVVTATCPTKRQQKQGWSDYIPAPGDSVCYHKTFLRGERLTVINPNPQNGRPTSYRHVKGMLGRVRSLQIQY